MKNTRLIFGACLLTACIGLNPATPNAQDAPMTTAPNTQSMSQKNAHNFTFTSIDGKKVDLSEMKDKAVLVVNTASKCGFTGQYAGLQKLHEKYGDKGLVVIGVPSGDFAGQEFADEKDVQNFTEEKFDITFTLTKIEHVKGKDAHPFYKWANNQAGFLGGPKWNFHKYLIDKQGNFVSAFSSATKPESTKLVEAIEQELAKK